MATVGELLEDLGLGEIPVLLVFNKRDRAPVEAVELARRHEGIAVAASAGDGLERLVGFVIDRLSRQGAWERRERQAQGYTDEE